MLCLVDVLNPSCHNRCPVICMFCLVDFLKPFSCTRSTVISSVIPRRTISSSNVLSCPMPFHGYIRLCASDMLAYVYKKHFLLCVSSFASGCALPTCTLMSTKKHFSFGVSSFVSGCVLPTCSLICTTSIFRCVYLLLYQAVRFQHAHLFVLKAFFVLCIFFCLPRVLFNCGSFCILWPQWVDVMDRLSGLLISLLLQFYFNPYKPSEHSPNLYNCKYRQGLF